MADGARTVVVVLAPSLLSADKAPAALTAIAAVMLQFGRPPTSPAARGVELVSEPRTFTVGLTGGIGSGKSVVLAEFGSRGAIGIEADDLAREVVEPGTEGFGQVVDAFGSDVVDG